MIELLDNRLVKYLSLIDEYISLIFMFFEILKKGYLCIGKANYNNKYSYNCLTIQEKYDKRMKAIYGVNIYEKNIELIELKKINKVEETSRIDIEEEISMNPLYWYGILVPQELKEAQQYFKEGINSEF